MRTTKRIIIRIIVAVVVAFILSKFRVLGLMKVSALETATSNISDVCGYNTLNTFTCYDVNEERVYNKPFKGATLPTISNSYVGISFSSTFSDTLLNKSGDLQFVIYSPTMSGKSSPSFQAYALNSRDEVFTCTVSSNTQIYHYQQYNNYYDYFYGMSGIVSVHCNNLTLRDRAWTRVFISGDFSSMDGTPRPLQILVSKQTFSYSSNDDKLASIESTTKDTNNFLKNDSTSGAESKAEAFFNDFDSNDYGLKDVVLAPVSFIESLLDYQCHSLSFPLPFVNENVVLPCMSTIYSQYPTFYTLWQMITTGMICYYVCLNIFGKVKQLTDPLNDRIEVIQL